MRSIPVAARVNGNSARGARRPGTGPRDGENGATPESQSMRSSPRHPEHVISSIAVGLGLAPCDAAPRSARKRIPADILAISTTALPDGGPQPAVRPAPRERSSHPARPGASEQTVRENLARGVHVDDYPSAMIARSGWDSSTFARNAWIYVQCRRNVPYKEIRHRMQRDHPNWDPIASNQGIQKAARCFAQRVGLPEPPARQRGRRRKRRPGTKQGAEKS